MWAVQDVKLLDVEDVAQLELTPVDKKKLLLLISAEKVIF